MSDEVEDAVVHVLERGKFYFDNGATYEGEWKYLQEEAGEEQVEGTPTDAQQIVRHGTGKYIEGDYSYDGEWHEDHMHGRGSFHFASGNMYEGEFQVNVYHGHGTFSWTDGSSYTGDWKRGKMHGQGSYIDVDGHKWDGQFYNGTGPGLRCNV